MCELYGRIIGRESKELEQLETGTCQQAIRRLRSLAVIIEQEREINSNWKLSSSKILKRLGLKWHIQKRKNRKVHLQKKGKKHMTI